VLNDKSSEMDYGEYMCYCVDTKHREQALEGWPDQWTREVDGNSQEISFKQRPGSPSLIYHYPQ
jgi:hypothetical protein